MGFAKYFGKKLFAAVVMIFVVASFTFFLVRWMPGDPAMTAYQNYIQSGMPEEVAAAQVRMMYGFQPHGTLLHQYIEYLGQLAQFNLGKSIQYTGVAVSHLIVNAAPWTLILGITGVLASFIVGVLAGVIAAVWRNSWIGHLNTFLGTLLHGIPQFMVALFLAYMFTTKWKLFPFGAPYDAHIHPGFTGAYIGSLAEHAVLPIIAYAISGYGTWLLTMKSSVTSVLGDEFILAAELRGLTRSIRLRYIARNALLPLFTGLTLSLAFMFGGSVFIEQIYDYPGLGVMLSTSVGVKDYALMQGAFLIITAAVIIANLLADILYTVIDPRIRR